LPVTQAVLTVAFYLGAFFIGSKHVLLFNVIFSHLWIVAVAFTASDWTYNSSPLLHAVESFSFIALCVHSHNTLLQMALLLTLFSFFSFFSVLYHWHTSQAGLRTTSTV
jgi:hypothetical protein